MYYYYTYSMYMSFLWWIKEKKVRHYSTSNFLSVCFQARKEKFTFYHPVLKNPKDKAKNNRKVSRKEHKRVSSNVALFNPMNSLKTWSLRAGLSLVCLHLSCAI